MDVKEIKRIFDLLCKVNTEDFCKVTELAKELGVKKTQLMQFIDDNPKLFNMGTLTVNRYRRNERSHLVVMKVYLSAEDNPSSDEWLELAKEKNKQYIHIDEIEDYGYIYGYHVVLDKDRKGKWRNTQEKIDFLKSKGVLVERKFCIGYFGDSCVKTYSQALSDDGFNKLKELGWSHNEVKKKE